MTWSSCVVSVVSEKVVLTLNPDSSSVVCAVALSRLITSGTVDVAGPFETCRTTAACSAVSWLPAGDWSTTSPEGRSESTSCRRTAKPAVLSCADAWSYWSPTTEGRNTCLGPLDLLMRTFEPSTTTVPAFGSWATIVSAGWSEGTLCTFATRFAPASAATASVAVLPTTPGTATLGLPVETWSTTIEPRPSLVPGGGSCSKT